MSNRQEYLMYFYFNLILARLNGDKIDVVFLTIAVFSLCMSIYFLIKKL